MLGGRFFVTKGYTVSIDREALSHNVGRLYGSLRSPKFLLLDREGT